MCGIAGIISNTRVEKPLEAMLSAMKHRGPDDRGVWIKEGVHLGHNRLSIIDLSPAGHQPMQTPDGRYTIVFNGEVYNFRQLRQQFLSDELFSSDTDTEVVLKLFRKLGIAALEHLRGMFSFLVWDAHEQTLWGVRDRMGIKPLWYYQKEGQLVLASEIKALLASGLVPFEVNKEAIRQFFLYGSAQQPLSFIENVFSIPPASYLKYGKDHLEITPYWSFPCHKNHRLTIEGAIEEFKTLYKESIELRLISDRTVGLFLSSGLDSVSMLAASKSIAQNIRTFTIGFETPHPKFYSEAKEAAQLSVHFGYPNDAVVVDESMALEDFDHFVTGLDQPSIDGLNTWIVSKYSKSYLTVALSGLGGDELMLGYPRNINLFNRTNRNIQLPGKMMERYVFKRANHANHNSKIWNRLLNYAGGAADLRVLYWSNSLLNQPWQVNNIMGTSERAEKDYESFYHFDTDNYQSEPFNQIAYYEMRTYMLNQLLRDMDAVSMAHSIEVRFPLIDHKLVEFLFTLPHQYKYHSQGQGVNHKTGKMTYSGSGIKWLMQKSYGAELPTGYLNTAKQGFQLPVYKWLIKKQSQEIEAALRQMEIESLSIEKQAIHQSITNLQKGIFGKNDYLLYILGKWHSLMKKQVRV